MKTAKRNANPAKPVELGRYIVANPRVCHGKPTFRGTRIMVQQVLADVASGKSWDFISRVRWGGRVTEPAIAEAVALARRMILSCESWTDGGTRKTTRKAA